MAEKENNKKKAEIGYVKERKIVEEMKESYLSYAMSVIVSRALPDVRDGLKPVHRRILYSMYEMGLRHNVKFRKSATVVGECLGKFHPHGDLAVYDALVRMAQDFSLRYPLVQGQGNFGSIDGDSAAAQRYTECRLSAVGEEMLKDIEKETVDFRPNYDGTRKEPVVLPSPFPQLLLNGSFGIAVGMATSIPPHNLSEVIDASVFLLENPGATTEDLLKFVKGPDFPTGGFIYGKKDIINAYSTGKGPILARGKAIIEETKKGYSQIIVTEIPFQVQKSELVREMARLVEEKKVDGIRNIRDESDREGMRIVVELKKDAFPAKILNAFYKYTSLQKTFYLNMLALVDGIKPIVLSLSDVLTYYLGHKKEVVVRRTKFDLNKAKERAHVLEGLMIALNNIDEVIGTIKKSENKDDAQKNLIKKFKLTEIQANAILEMKLQNLAKLEREKIEAELRELEKKIKGLNLILKSQAKLKEVMKNELLEIKNRFGDSRKTKVFSSKPGEIAEEDLVANEESIIVLTKGGYIKRMKPTVYKSQNRGGKGVSGINVSNDDMIDHFLTANTHDKLLFFTDSGKVFQCQAWEIPEMSKISKGRGILNFLEISRTEKILSVVPYTKEDEGKEEYLVMVTENGLVKKTALSAFKNVRRNGLIAIKLNKEDSLKSVKIAKPGSEIILTTKEGKSIRFKEKDLRSMGRAAAGVRGIRLAKEDKVVGMDIIRELKEEKKIKLLLIVTENGYGKRTKIKEYRLQKRGGSGIKAAKITANTGRIVFSKAIDEKEKDLLVVSKKGQIIRLPINSISIIGRVASGVKVMRLKPEDKVASATCL